MNFLDDGTAEEIYEHISLTIDGRFYNCKYSQILGCHNNWILMIFLMMEHMNNITRTLIEIFLMVM